MQLIMGLTFAFSPLAFTPYNRGVHSSKLVKNISYIVIWLKGTLALDMEIVMHF
jgi:hypothetical protein